MSPYFYSLGMLVSGRMVEQRYLSAMDVLAGAIANEEMIPEPPSIISFMFKAQHSDIQELPK